MKNKISYRTAEILLTLLAMSMLIFTIWFVWHSEKVTDKTLANTGNSSVVTMPAVAIKTFDECKASAGSVMQETYPEVCVTKAGKKFVGPNTPTNASSLVMMEWGIQVPLTSNITDATYTMSDAGLVHLSTKRLTALDAQVMGCSAGINDIYLQRSTAPNNSAVKVGAYYYSRKVMIEPQCIPESAIDVRSQTAPIQAELVTAIRNITAN